MKPVTRREFVKMASLLAVSFGWPASLLNTPSEKPEPLVETVADALVELDSGTAPVIWLTGQGCSGCSISFLNAAYPDPAQVITRYISLNFHPVLSAASGETAVQALNQRIEAGNYLLVVEGAVPQGMPSACRVNDEDFTQLLIRAAQNAKAVLAAGTCASFGGISTAPSNPTGSVSVIKFLRDQHSTKPVISLPGCPIHPDWLVGTLVHLLKFGMPALTQQSSPEMFYGSVIHTRCPQFYNYNMGKFASFFGDDGCLFKLGCLGIRTYADCATRRWNNKVNWCIEAGAPCIACASPQFAQDREFPFFRVRET